MSIIIGHGSPEPIIEVKTAAEFCKELEEAKWLNMWNNISHKLKRYGVARVEEKLIYYSTFGATLLLNGDYKAFSLYIDKFTTLGYKVTKESTTIEYTISETVKVKKTKFFNLITYYENEERKVKKIEPMNVYIVSACCDENK